MSADAFIEVGQSYQVRPVHGGYPLPQGLKEGDRVKVVAQPDRAIWYDVITEDGREFHLYGPQLRRKTTA